jgi:4-amino-4-deoxy-L-arabinose transferase-like glycosyltransferase
MPLEFAQTANRNGAANPMHSRWFYRALPYLACLLACSIVNLFYFPSTTIFPDEQRFLSSAIRLAATGEFWVGPDRAWEMPGTALFYAPAVWLFGPREALMAIRVAQSFLVAIQCGLVASMARRLFGNGIAALCATWMVALYPFFLFYQGLLLSETLFDTLLLAAVAALYWWRERGLRIEAALVVTCLLFAAATLTKATLTILPPLLMAATALTAGATLRRVLTILVAASCVYAAALSPWWIRNATLLHTFVPFTTGSAQNLYLGNNPRNPTAGVDWASNVDQAVVAKIEALPNELDRQRAFNKAAIEYIKDNPAIFVRAAAQKFMRFWNPVPNAAEFKTGLYAVISAISFGPVLALALLCAVWQWRQWRQLAPIYLIVGYFTFVYVVSIASLRYRLPLEPLLIVLAAAPLAAIVESVRRR